MANIGINLGKSRLLLFNIVLIVGVCMMACGKKDLSEPAENQFDAKVIEIYDEYIMVEALEGQDIVGEVRVQIGLLKENELSVVKTGDKVRITHDGKMTMSLPPQMTAVEIIKINP